MSNHRVNKTRRIFLKGAVYTSALSLGGLSSVALATSCSRKTMIQTAEANTHCAISNVNGIRIIQQTKHDRETVTLFNQSGKLHMLDARQPVSLHQVNGILIVTVNQSKAQAVNGMVLMSPNERVTFDVKAIGIDVADTADIPQLTTLAENQLEIVSEHSVFNRILPVELA